jgi:hypothetical protein
MVMVRSWPISVSLVPGPLLVASSIPYEWLLTLGVVNANPPPPKLPSQIPMEEGVGSGLPQRAPKTRFYVGIEQDT